jgi:hypothetical protein
MPPFSRGWPSAHASPTVAPHLSSPFNSPKRQTQSHLHPRYPSIFSSPAGTPLCLRRAGRRTRQAKRLATAHDSSRHLLSRTTPPVREIRHAAPAKFRGIAPAYPCAVPRWEEVPTSLLVIILRVWFFLTGSCGVCILRSHLHVSSSLFLKSFSGWI